MLRSPLRTLVPVDPSSFKRNISQETAGGKAIIIPQ